MRIAWQIQTFLAEQRASQIPYTIFALAPWSAIGVLLMLPRKDAVRLISEFKLTYLVCSILFVSGVEIGSIHAEEMLLYGYTVQRSDVGLLINNTLSKESQSRGGGGKGCHSDIPMQPGRVRHGAISRRASCISHIMGCHVDFSYKTADGASRHSDR